LLLAVYGSGQKGGSEVGRADLEIFNFATGLLEQAFNTKRFLLKVVSGALILLCLKFTLFGF
jgi:hypothetical protein